MQRRRGRCCSARRAWSPPSGRHAREGRHPVTLDFVELADRARAFVRLRRVSHSCLAMPLAPRFTACSCRSRPSGSANFDAHLKMPAQHVENRGQVVHAGVAADGQHAMQTLLGRAAAAASPSKPAVALTGSPRIKRAVAGSPLRNSEAASSSSGRTKAGSRCTRSTTVNLASLVCENRMTTTKAVLPRRWRVSTNAAASSSRPAHDSRRCQ